MNNTNNGLRFRLDWLVAVLLVAIMISAIWHFFTPDPLTGAIVSNKVTAMLLVVLAGIVGAIGLPLALLVKPKAENGYKPPARGMVIALIATITFFGLLFYALVFF